LALEDSPDRLKKAAMPAIRRATDDKRAIAALLAVFALLVQALIPSLAAASAGPGPNLGVICAASGLAHSGGPSAPAHLPGEGCDHCVCPMAAAPAPDATASAVPVRYATYAAPTLSRREGLSPGRGLAAPPPPSRGPPQLTI
jgi:hypothetical protein